MVGDDPNGRNDQDEMKRSFLPFGSVPSIVCILKFLLIQVYLRSGTLIGLLLWLYSFLIPFMVGDLVYHIKLLCYMGNCPCTTATNCAIMTDL